MSNVMEKKILKVSALGALFFAVLGIAWGWAIDSNMIIFDGLYSFISVGLALLSLYTCNFIAKKDFEKFPFGKHVLEPIIISIKSIVIAVMCLISLKNAVFEILAGGNPVDTSRALVYAIISTVGCSVVYIFMKKKGKRLSSDLIIAESNGWLMDTIVSAGVLVGFIISFIISKTNYAYLTIYIDPVMVVITSTVFLRVPIKTFLNSFKEVIGVCAPKEITGEVETSVEGIKKEYNLKESITKVLKVGRNVRIDVMFVVDGDSTLRTLEEMDEIRSKLYDEIEDIEYYKDINVMFTTNANLV